VALAVADRDDDAWVIVAWRGAIVAVVVIAGRMVGY
jgi:hypothetical protein